MLGSCGLFSEPTAVTSRGSSRDFLAIEGLVLSDLRAIIDRAERLLPAAVGDAPLEERLRGRVIANLFSKTPPVLA